MVIELVGGVASQTAEDLEPRAGRHDRVSTIGFGMGLAFTQASLLLALERSLLHRQQLVKNQAPQAANEPQRETHAQPAEQAVRHVGPGRSEPTAFDQQANGDRRQHRYSDPEHRALEEEDHRQGPRQEQRPGAQQRAKLQQGAKTDNQAKY